MTEQPLVVELPGIWLNQSRWKNYQSCDRLYGWMFVEGLMPKRSRAVLDLGSAVHAAQVMAHSNGATEQAFKDATAFAEKDFRRRIIAGRPGPKLPGDDDEVEQGVATVQRMLPAYFEHYKAKGQLWKPLGMEVVFCVEVGEGTNVWLVGTIDNLVTYMNHLWLVDYKTMGRLDMRDFLKYEIDIQLTAYIYGGTKQLSIEAKAQGRPPVMIRGAIIDGLVKTAVPQFHRELYTRTIDDLRQFELEFCMKAWEIASKQAMAAKDRKTYNLYRDKMYDLGSPDWKIAFPKNTSQCFAYGTCSHRDLCVKDNDVRRLAFTNRRDDYVDEARQRALKAVKMNVESE